MIFLNANTLSTWVKLESVTWDVQRFGVENGFLSSHDAVHFALARLKAKIVVSSTEEEIALLLSDELDRFPELLTAGPAPDREIAARVWAFTGLSEVRFRWATLERPWDEIAEMLEILDEPAGYKGLVYYGPIPLLSRAPGIKGLTKKLDNILSKDGQMFGYADGVMVARSEGSSEPI